MLDKEFFQQKRKIYFTGIGGIGVSALARYFKALGNEVLGSDLVKSSVVEDLQQEGIEVFLKQKSKNISKNIDLLIYSSAVPASNEERQRAKKLKIPQYSYNDLLAYLSEQKRTIAISGTNGKTTTTAMTALMLEKADIDPLALVGSKVPNWNSNLRFSNGDIFVLEACEYKGHMLGLSPEMIVLTNIVEDHLDYYKDIDDILEHFQKYIDKLPDNGVLIYNADDSNIKCLEWQHHDYKLISFAIDSDEADLTIHKHTISKGVQDFWVYYNGKKLCRIKLYVPGIYNVYNALATVAVGLALGIDPELIKEGLANFKGVWRRFEIIKEVEEILYISDYAHHPESVKLSVAATREFYPERRVVTVFQPHQHNRTKNLFDDFVKALSNSDVVIISDIYDVAGREEASDQDVSSEDLVKEIAKLNKNVFYGGDLNQTLKVLNEVKKADDVVLLMGAGSIDDLRYEI